MQQGPVCNKLPPSAMNLLFQVPCGSTVSCFRLPHSQALMPATRELQAPVVGVMLFLF